MENITHMGKSLLGRFNGPAGRGRLLAALQDHKLVDNRLLASELARSVILEAFSAGQTVIEQHSHGRDLFLILAGGVAVKADGQVVVELGANQYFGEVGLLDPKGRRTAGVIAISDSIVARIKAADFYVLADKYPRLWRTIATDLACRLLASSSNGAQNLEPQRSAS